MAEVKAGVRFRSAVCSTEVMVVAAPAGGAELCCGGVSMIDLGAEPSGGSPAADASEGTAMGKRYANEAGDLEVLCTKPGDGSLAADGTALKIKGAKPLPSSD